MTIGELKKYLEEMKIKDDANIHIIQKVSCKEPVLYRPEHIAKSLSDDLIFIIYGEGLAVSDHDY